MEEMTPTEAVANVATAEAAEAAEAEEEAEEEEQAATEDVQFEAVAEQEEDHKTLKLT